MVPYEQAETIVAIRVFMTSTEPYRTREWVSGKNWDAEIADVKQDIREVTEAERFEDLPTLTARLADYRWKNEHEATAGEWAYEDTGLTVGEHFDGLDAEGRREYLKTRDIRVERSTTVDGLPGIHVIIDGQDHGTSPYPHQSLGIASHYERPSTTQHNQPTLGHKLLDRSPDRISAHAILVSQLKLAR